jgi:hypothetical protein
MYNTGGCARLEGMASRQDAKTQPYKNLAAWREMRFDRVEIWFALDKGSVCPGQKDGDALGKG